MPKSNRRELWLVWQLINDNDNDKHTDNDKHKYDENKNEYGKYLFLVSLVLLTLKTQKHYTGEHCLYLEFRMLGAPGNA